ncbi:uncharacterized protein BXZ73DRAFT_78123 [Epithele typhae]|uniref:uncharacterized protein n=1 Tax=Epithele typhae TaxID=378194 RepID=UPI00200835C8|nr:uncharacterized protein BXZ73DRAFT_78123 [Epithele typhae]KAH9929568.1 hypothetical protein BXZ73DRAFT_78123 [Epithele typhae]
MTREKFDRKKRWQTNTRIMRVVVGKDEDMHGVEKWRLLTRLINDSFTRQCHVAPFRMPHARMGRVSAADCGGCANEAPRFRGTGSRDIFSASTSTSTRLVALYSILLFQESQSAHIMVLLVVVRLVALNPPDARGLAQHMWTRRMQAFRRTPSTASKAGMGMAAIPTAARTDMSVTTARGRAARTASSATPRVKGSARAYASYTSPPQHQPRWPTREPLFGEDEDGTTASPRSACGPALPVPPGLAARPFRASALPLGAHNTRFSMEGVHVCVGDGAGHVEMTLGSPW